MLVDFLKDLFETGELKVGQNISEPTEHEESIAVEILQHYFDLYKLDFPGGSSLHFNAEAAFWATCYLYRLCQALVLRELTEEQVVKMLPAYNLGRTTGEVISVDLIFQFIPEIYKVSQILSPKDVLVSEIKELAKNWGLSLFKIADELEVDYLEENEVLLAIFTNRIIEQKHLKSVVSPKIKEHILIQLGAHQTHFWNELKELEHDN